MWYTVIYTAWESNSFCFPGCIPIVAHQGRKKHPTGVLPRDTHQREGLYQR